MTKNVILTLAIILLAAQASAFEFCSEGTSGDKDLRLISIDDMLKENSKEWTWHPSQKIKIEARVENLNDESATYILEIIFKDAEKTIRIAEDSSDLEKEFSLSANERESISLEFTIDEDVDAKNYDIYMKFYKKNNENDECVESSEEEIIIEKIEVCGNGRVDSDELEITRIKDRLQDNENKWDWTPGDNIKVLVDLENKDYSQRNFITELIFLDENNEEVFLTDNSNDMIKETNLDEDENDNINFNFKLKSNIEEAKYTLYAKFYDKGNDNICTSLKAEGKSSPILISIEKEERKVIVTNVQGPKNITTSSQEQYTATITNFGSADESKVLVIMYNYQLDINEKIEIRNLDSGEERTITFNVSIPENSSSSRYALLFATEYEYNEKQDYYKSISSEDDDIKYRITVTQEKQTKTITGTAAPITTIITGNTIGIPNESPNWIVLALLLILAIIGIFLFFKKPQPRKITKVEPPRVIRRYTAKIN